MNEIDPNDLDANIRDLVTALNAFGGIQTIGSCGGHPDPRPGQWAEGTWYVTFTVGHSESGWFALEFLAWLINNDYRRAGHHVMLYPTSPPPYLNQPGQSLRFALEGYDGEEPEALAAWVNQLRAECFVAPVDMEGVEPT